jgi:hypothetical protein
VSAVLELRAEPLTGVVAEHGEGPVWDERRGRLVSVDMLAGALLVTDPATGATSRHDVPSPVAAMARPTADGWLVVGEREVFHAEADLTGFRQVGELPTAGGVRANDGGCDPAGRLYVGTMAYDQTPGAGDLFVRQLDGTVEVALAGVTVSNGLSFGPEPGTACYVDTATQRVERLSFDARGHVSRRQPLVEVPSEGRQPGRPHPRRRRRDLGRAVGRRRVHRYGRRGAGGPRRAPGPARHLLRVRRPGAGRALHHHLPEGLTGDTGTAGAVFRCTPGTDRTATAAGR